MKSGGMRWMVVVGLCLCGLGLAPMADATVIIATDPSVPAITTAMTGFETLGDMMVGMTVTAYFAGGGSEQAVWAATGLGAGAAVGTGWSLSLSGDSFLTNFILDYNAGVALERLVLDGAPGQTVFDRTLPDPGTLNSAAGIDFTEYVAPGGLTMTVTYRNPLALNADPPVLDEWVKLDIEFSMATGGGLPSGSDVEFMQDTDNASTAIVVIPEPMTLSLLALGGLGLLSRRRRNR